MSLTNLNLTLEDVFSGQGFFAESTAATEMMNTAFSHSEEEEKWIAMRQYYSKVLMGLARDPHTAAGLMGLNATGLGGFLSPHDSALANLSIHLTSLVKRRKDPGRTVIIILVYSILIVVSLFGNLLVCHVVLRTRRLHTLTNTFLANLAVSDLLMTALNIPFNVARVLLDDWPFGRFMCSVVPFVQVTSVYVSAFTMVVIALDRYQVIVHPLKPRLGTFHGAIIIVVVWLLAAFVSLPYAIYSEVVEVFTYRKLTRCQAHYPPPALQFRQWLTLATFLTQYVIPLIVTAVAYVGVTRRVWWRAVVGAATQEQLSLQLRAKKKTVKMLLVVVILFALCWLPLNTYHLVVDFGASVGPSRHSSSIFFICHWFAMSNVCYNPFIYCWLNDHFRAGAKAWLRCAGQKICRIPFPEDIEETPGARVARPRDSITLSSSALAGGSSVRRKVGGSVRSNHASDFHVTLDELMITPTSARSVTQRYGTNPLRRSGRRGGQSHSSTSVDSHHEEEDKGVQTDDVSLSLDTSKISPVTSYTHGFHCVQVLSEVTKVSVDPPQLLDSENLVCQGVEVSNDVQLGAREKVSKSKIGWHEIDKSKVCVPQEIEYSLDNCYGDKEAAFINLALDPKQTLPNPLLSIPEESPKFAVLKGCDHCQQSKENKSFSKIYHPSNTDIYIYEKEAFDRSEMPDFLETKKFENDSSKAKNTETSVQTTHAKVSASLGRKLSATMCKNSLITDIAKNSQKKMERPSLPSISFLKNELSSHLTLINKCEFLNDSRVSNPDSVSIHERNEDPNEMQAGVYSTTKKKVPEFCTICEQKYIVKLADMQCRHQHHPECDHKCVHVKKLDTLSNPSGGFIAISGTPLTTEIATQTSLDSTLRTSSTPNIHLSRNVPALSQQSSQSSGSFVPHPLPVSYIPHGNDNSNDNIKIENRRSDHLINEKINVK